MKLIQTEAAGAGRSTYVRPCERHPRPLPVTTAQQSQPRCGRPASVILSVFSCRESWSALPTTISWITTPGSAYLYDFSSAPSPTFFWLQFAQLSPNQNGFSLSIDRKPSRTGNDHRRSSNGID